MHLVNIENHWINPEQVCIVRRAIPNTVPDGFITEIICTSGMANVKMELSEVIKLLTAPKEL